MQKCIWEFYPADECSFCCPGKKEFVSVYTDGVKCHKQKPLLLINLKELHLEFLRSINYQESFSKFCQLCPKWHVTTMTYPEIFWGDLFQQGVGEGGCDTPLWVQGKALVGTRQQSSQKLQRFSTLKSLTVIPSTTYDDTHSTYFFQKSCLNSSLK